MFSKASNKRSLLSYSGNAAFKKRIAPKIAAHIERPIDVSLSGEDACLNKWLLDNLSTILPIHITLASGRSSAQWIVKPSTKKAKYE
jgi:uracil-DNA glycosylase